MNYTRKYNVVNCNFQGYREVPERLRLHPEHISQGGDPQSWLEYSWHHLHTARDLAQAIKLTSSNQWHLHFSSSNHGLLAHLNKFKESKPGPLPIIKLMAPSKYQNCGPPSKYQNCGTYSPSTFRKDTASLNLKIAGMPKTRLR